MNKAKLELINIKEDVIATSLSCEHAHGIALILNNTRQKSLTNTCEQIKVTSDLSNVSDGFYHLNEEGQIIGVCPTWNHASSHKSYNYDEINAAHNTNFDNRGDCLSKGTKITMSDNSIKNIEDIKEGDVVLTYNHEKGKYEGQKIYLVYKSEEPKCPFTLHFTNGINISVIGDHNFFEKESLTYASIFESNAESFIGKHFYNPINNRYEELLSVTHEKEPVDYYEIYSEYNANCIAENMLNCPNDSSEVLNIYKFNEDLTIDHNQLEKDIKEFGLLEYPKDANYSKEIFDKLCWKYVKLMVGKGFGTMDEFIARKDAFLENFNNG